MEEGSGAQGKGLKPHHSGALFAVGDTSIRGAETHMVAHAVGLTRLRPLELTFPVGEVAQADLARLGEAGIQ